MKVMRLVFLVALLMRLLSQAGEAQTVTIIHSFNAAAEAGIGINGPNQDALTIGTDGNFYGTTYAGGTAGAGTFFRLTPSGSFTVLHNFGDGSVPNDGRSPNGPLLLGSDGNFYGTTYLGGSTTDLKSGNTGLGTVIKITPAGDVTVLHSFDDGTVPHDGADPISPLILGSDGSFYGTTDALGEGGDGTVFKITPAGTETILHSFPERLMFEGGRMPCGLVLGNDGNYYGLTTSGGALDLEGEFGGTVFEITPSGTLTYIHLFGDGTVPGDGTNPEASLVQGADGNFYGTTAGFFGTVFKITPSGTETILHTFNDGTVPDDGQSSFSTLLLAPDGNFYGTTRFGGTAGNGAYGFGTIYRISPTGDYTILHDFSDGSVPGDGAVPEGDLTLGPDGNIYGLTFQGGANNQGTIFRLSLSPTPVWYSRNVAAASDGSVRMLWTRSDRAAGLWTLNKANTVSAVGPTYGPYADSNGTWAAGSVKVAGDGTARLLWTRSDGAAGLWSLDASNTVTVIGSTAYGPLFNGTDKAVALAVAPDGTSRILWTSSSGQAAVATFGKTDTEVSAGTIYGPYQDWSATAIGVAADGTSRILWTRTDGAAGLWTLDASGTLLTVGPTYGPYSDAHGTWSATGIGTSADGSSQVLWSRTDGAAGVWTFNAKDIETAVGPVYGPFPGWTAAGLDSSGDQSRVLWTNASRAAGLWTFGANDVESVIGSTYGPY